MSLVQLWLQTVRIPHSPLPSYVIGRYHANQNVFAAASALAHFQHTSFPSPQQVSCRWASQLDPVIQMATWVSEASIKSLRNFASRKHILKIILITWSWSFTGSYEESTVLNLLDASAMSIMWCNSEMTQNDLNLDSKRPRLGNQHAPQAWSVCLILQPRRYFSVAELVEPPNI